MTFPFDIYLVALLGSFLAAFLSLPAWRHVCLRMGLIDDPGHRKIHDRPIPLAGGLAILCALLMAIGVIGLLLHLGILDRSAGTALNHGVERRGIQLGGILIGALGMTLLGLLDDKHELRPSVKFMGQCAIGLMVAASGVRITLFVPSAVFSVVITVLWIITLTNALNFMDNMNGLCSGLGAIAAWCFAVIAAMEGQYLVATMALLIVGALAGFLPHNFPGARAFLGDAGSHLTGYLLSVLAILPHFYTPERPRHLTVLTPLLILAIPLADLAHVVLVRTANKKAFYLGDTNHFSHRLVRLGLSKTFAVLIIWLAAILCGALGVWLNRG